MFLLKRSCHFRFHVSGANIISLPGNRRTARTNKPSFLICALIPSKAYLDGNGWQWMAENVNSYTLHHFLKQLSVEAAVFFGMCVAACVELYMEYSILKK